MSNGLRAVIVCVDFSDYLQITLPYNRHHFDEVLVITTPDDTNTMEVAAANGAMVYGTRDFYDGPSVFNKWKALEHGLDYFGRDGWICLLDADILWPKQVDTNYEPGNLYTPFRRMVPDPASGIPSERQWNRYARHPNVGEFAGYSQIFHGSDPHLGPAPWHQINWRHAGGADSFFQQKWPAECKVRPPFEVLHLGESGVNWCGRATEYIGGGRHPAADLRRARLNKFIQSRTHAKGLERFKGEMY